MASNCYSIEFPSVHAHFPFLLLQSSCPHVYWGLSYFFWTLWLPKCVRHRYSPGMPQGQEPHPISRKDQRRECVLMEEQEAVLHAQSEGTGSLSPHVSITFDSGMLCLRQNNHPSSILEKERAFFQFNSVFLCACAVVVPTTAWVFPICFPIKCSKWRGVQQHRIVEVGKLIL